MTKSNSGIVCDLLHRQYNLRDITAVDDYIAEDHVDHNPIPGQEQGREGVRKAIQHVIDDAETTCQIHLVISEGDLVCSRYTLTKQHTRDFLGIRADGKTTRFHVIGIDRLENGQIIESWGALNSLDALGNQLGVDLGIPWGG